MCEQVGIRCAAYTTFTALWRQLAPQIMVMKPMSDLCWVCQKNSTAIMRASNRPESEKSEVITEYLLHLKQLNSLDAIGIYTCPRAGRFTAIGIFICIDSNTTLHCTRNVPIAHCVLLMIPEGNYLVVVVVMNVCDWLSLCKRVVRW